MTTTPHPAQTRLLDPEAGLALPDGLIYQEAFLSEAEEAALLDAIRDVEMHDIVMHGVVARRRSHHYGWKYDYASWKLDPGPPIPAFLLPLRRRAAEFAGVDEAAFEEALINQYTPGAGIGWHRDSPAFGIVVGVSLGAACQLRLRRDEKTPAADWIRLQLPPRSAYLLSGPARHVWQHSIPPLDDLRYSVTFRTLTNKK
jgi:alkylated DNA repair dioxygenase AlkB